MSKKTSATATSRSHQVVSTDMEALFDGTATPLEKELAKVSSGDASADNVEQVKSNFRDLLTDEQRAVLRKNAPALAKKMVHDYNALIEFGSPVLEKLNQSSRNLLETQKSVEVPEADAIVNTLMRQMDGYSAKYRNKRIDGFFAKVLSLFRGAKYSIATMVRDAKPIEEKLDMVEKDLREMELKLSNNVSNGQVLHEDISETLEEVVSVLAALEEINEVAHEEFTNIEKLLHETEQENGIKSGSVNVADSNHNDEGVITVIYNGEQITLETLRRIHAEYAAGVSEMEKTWFDWRQQFFINSAQTPATLNLILVSTTMQRRAKVFRTMALPQARRALAMWQQAAIAQEAADLGEAFQKGTNKMITDAFESTNKAVHDVAYAAQAPLLEENTIWKIVDSLQDQCRSLVEADKWGREQRAKNLKAMEQGEKAIQASFSKSRKDLVQGALDAMNEGLDPAPVEGAFNDGNLTGDQLLTQLK